MTKRKFPLQTSDLIKGCYKGKAEVDWDIAKIAYTEYALQFGTQQSLERLAERGGFGALEIIVLLVELIKRQGKRFHELRENKR